MKECVYAVIKKYYKTFEDIISNSSHKYKILKIFKSEEEAYMCKMEKDFFNLDKILNSDKLFTYEVKNFKINKYTGSYELWQKYMILKILI